MINLRYHIVSLAAVFLALALGAVVGTTAINPQVVTNYRRLNLERQKTLDAVSATSKTQEGALEVWEKLGTTLMPELTHDALKGMRVYLVEHDGTPDDLATGVEDALTTAGATDVGRVVLSKRWRLSDDGARAQLATDVRTTETEVSKILEGAAAALAARLSQPADPTKTGDLLDTLARDGFLSLRGIEAGAFPPKGSTVVVLWSGAVEGFPDPAHFGLPFVRALPVRTPVVIAEPFESRASLVGRLRGDDELERRVGGIDHVDLIPGQLSLVAALRDVAAGSQAPQYGTGRGATAVVPPLTFS